MPVNAGKNLCNQTQPCNTVDNVIYYTCNNLMNRKRKKILDEYITPQNMQQDINFTRPHTFSQRT